MLLFYSCCMTLEAGFYFFIIFLLLFRIFLSAHGMLHSPAVLSFPLFLTFLNTSSRLSQQTDSVTRCATLLLSLNEPPLERRHFPFFLFLGPRQGPEL